MKNLDKKRQEPTPDAGTKTEEDTVFVYRLEWEESERGFGVRPHGASLHLRLDDVAGFVGGHHRTNNNLPEVPECYSRPAGKATLTRVSRAVYEQLVEHRKMTDKGWNRFGLWET